MIYYDKILEILKEEYGWNLFDSLTEQGQKLVKDTLKARHRFEQRENKITREFKLILVFGIFALLALATVMSIAIILVLKYYN